MSIKPSVVYIKGVHSTTGSDQTSDIGFPNIGLDKLFEGTILKEYTGDYDPSKKYVYKSTPSNVAIENEYHFNCIKNGYDSINGIDHYYTLNGNDYIYNTADTSTWAGKWTLSNAINNETPYSISSEKDRIYISDSYYEKNNNNNYVKQTVETYDLYKEGQQVLWNVNHKYNASVIDVDDNFNNIYGWTLSNGTLATNGWYLSINEISNTFIVKLLNCTFNNGILQNNFTNLGTLYKLDTDNLFESNTWYIRNDNKLEKITANTDIVFNTNPTENSSFYLYQKLKSYTYPNTVAPETASLYTESNSLIYESFNKNNFPVYEIATATEISKTPHDSYTIYEKTAVKVNYYYSNEANSLQFVFTDKDIDGVLEACGLSDNIKKYVHLTNLKYNKN